MPTVLILFGATGDLVARKIIPSLFKLYARGVLPKLFRVIGFVRREMTSEDFQNYVSDILRKDRRLKAKPSDIKKFRSIFSYEKGEYVTGKDYKKLAKILGRIDGKWRACSNKLFYLAVTPELYSNIFRHLAGSGLTNPCGPEEGWTRVIVEKPFGKNLATAQKLDAELGKLFREEQIYRIDHYLAKQMLQNILAFRFSNNVFEKHWDTGMIEKIEVRLLEKIGVEERGDFYDGIGALRDVGQNHLLQMLALVTMENPGEFNAENIRRKRNSALELLSIPKLDEIPRRTFRAQYRGYKKIKGVRPESKTETYFKIRTFLKSPRWRGTPIFLESGKRMSETKKEVVITFRHPIPCLCPESAQEHMKNTITFRLEPKEEIVVQFWAKKPSLEFEMEKRVLTFSHHKSERGHIEPYEKMLVDCIRGDQTLFVSTLEVQSMWKFIDPIVKAWKRGAPPLHEYGPGDAVIREKAAREVDGWPRLDKEFKKEIGIVGLGKMGGGIARRLMERGWRVVGCNRTVEVVRKFEKEGLLEAYSYKELARKLHSPRLVWLMVPAGAPVEEAIFGKNGLVKYLKPGDIIIDGGNSFWKDSKERGRKLKKQGIRFLDVGVSGGPSGARNGACLMIGGEEKNFKALHALFYDLAAPNAYQFFSGFGAGHFVKMVHNGIEYGMMQALAEGFAVLRKSGYKLDLKRAADVYNHGSVIESRLVEWLSSGFEKFGEDLRGVSGTVKHTGEGEWTVKTAKELGVPVKIIEGSFQFRIDSGKSPSYIGKILSALRNQFGGHSI